MKNVIWSRRYPFNLNEKKKSGVLWAPSKAKCRKKQKKQTDRETGKSSQ